MNLNFCVKIANIFSRLNEAALSLQKVAKKRCVNFTHRFDGVGPSRQDPVAAAGGATRRSSDTIE